MRTEPYMIRIAWLNRDETIETPVWSKREALDEYAWVIGQFDGQKNPRPEQAALVALVAPNGSLVETCVA